MSNVTQTILFEYPLNEKMRTWLRVEFLFLQLIQIDHLIHLTETLAFFRTMDELLNVLDRSDIRTEILKELDRQQKKLQAWRDVSGVDVKQIDKLQQKIKENITSLFATHRFGQELKEDRLITSVRQRLNIPGGCCSFDLPTLHVWMHLPQNRRDEQVRQWLTKLAPLFNSLQLILDLIRQSGQFKPQLSLNGFFQDNADSVDLLRMNLYVDLQLYPQVSGHKSRYTIRFLSLDSENGKIPQRLTFELACC